VMGYGRIHSRQVHRCSFAENGIWMRK